MDLTTGIWVGAGLFLCCSCRTSCGKYVRARRAVTHGSRRNKERGHSDIGPDVGGVPYTKPGVDEARGARR